MGNLAHDREMGGVQELHKLVSATHRGRRVSLNDHPTRLAILVECMQRLHYASTISVSGTYRPIPPGERPLKRPHLDN